MMLIVESLTLNLRAPSRTARGTVRHNVLVRFEDGLGEGAIMPDYGHDYQETVAYLEAFDSSSLLAEDPLALIDALDQLPPGPAPARTAVDMALHDVWAKKMGYPLYRLWGLNPKRSPHSSLTINIPEDETELQKQLKTAKGWPILKLRLGTGDLDIDEDIVRLAQKMTTAQLCVDVNGAWSVDEAAQIIPRLAAYNLLFIEQPIAATKAEAWHRLRRLLPANVPHLIADESIQSPHDVTALVGVADGINIKLAKVGGLHAARQMIALAHTLGLRVVLGCTVESSLGITAAAHLTPIVDFVDLDGHLGLTNDPFVGLNLERGKLTLPQEPGIGVIRRPGVG